MIDRVLGVLIVVALVALVVFVMNTLVRSVSRGGYAILAAIALGVTVQVLLGLDRTYALIGYSVAGSLLRMCSGVSGRSWVAVDGPILSPLVFFSTSGLVWLNLGSVRASSLALDELPSSPFLFATLVISDSFGLCCLAEGRLTLGDPPSRSIGLPFPAALLLAVTLAVVDFVAGHAGAVRPEHGVGTSAILGEGLRFGLLHLAWAAPAVAGGAASAFLLQRTWRNSVGRG